MKKYVAMILCLIATTSHATKFHVDVNRAKKYNLVNDVIFNYKIYGGGLMVILLGIFYNKTILPRLLRIANPLPGVVNQQSGYIPTLAA